MSSHSRVGRERWEGGQLLFSEIINLQMIAASHGESCLLSLCFQAPAIPGLFSSASNSHSSALRLLAEFLWRWVSGNPGLLSALPALNVLRTQNPKHWMLPQPSDYPQSQCEVRGSPKRQQAMVPEGCLGPLWCMSIQICSG